METRHDDSLEVVGIFLPGYLLAGPCVWGGGGCISGVAR